MKARRRPTRARRGASLGWLAALGHSACLAGNPNFIEDGGRDDGTDGGGESTDTGADESTGAPACEIVADPLEDPDSEAEAVVQSTITILDEAQSGTINGELSPMSAAWWSRTPVVVDSVCGAQVSAELETASLDAPARVCAFVECTETELPPLRMDCGDGESATSPFGRPGCCGAEALTMTYECELWDHDLFVLVEPVEGGVCGPFNVNFLARSDPPGC